MSPKKLLRLLLILFAVTSVPLFLLVFAESDLFVFGLNPLVCIAMVFLLVLLVAVFLGRMIFLFFKTKWELDSMNLPALLFAIGAVDYSLIGYITSSHFGSQTLDFHFRDTYFVIANFHFEFFCAFLLLVFAIVYAGFPLIARRSLNTKLSYIHYWVTLFGLSLFLVPSPHSRLWAVDGGLPRRYLDYSSWNTLSFRPVNPLVDWLIVVFFLAQLLFVYNLLYSLVRGRRIGKDPGSVFLR